MLTTLLFLVLVGTIIALVVGTFWYSEATPMGKIHMRFLGFDKLSKEEKLKLIEKAKPTMWKMYLGQALLSLLSVTATVFIVSMSMLNGVPRGVALGFVVMNWAAFMVPVIGSSIIWGNCDRTLAWKKFVSDSAANLVTLLIVGLITSWFI